MARGVVFILSLEFVYYTLQLSSLHASGDGIRALQAGFGAECARALSVATRFAPSAVEATPGADHRSFTIAGPRRAVPRSFGRHLVRFSSRDAVTSEAYWVDCMSKYLRGSNE